MPVHVLWLPAVYVSECAVIVILSYAVGAMPQSKAAMALGGLAGGLVYFSSSNQGFAVAPATKLRQHHNVQTGQTPPSSASTSLPTMMVGGAVLAAAAASGRTSRSHAERTPQVARAVTPYELNGNVLADLEFSNDVGYLPDGTPMNRAGNAINHPENIGPDSHAPGSPLPRANFVNSVGYLPDGTPMNRAGNAINHPETIGPDLHTPGSPLPASTYAQDVGYLVDGTPMETAGNLSVQGGAAPAAPPPVAAAAFVGSSAPVSSPAPAPAAPAPAPAVSSPGAPRTAMYGRKFEYSFQKDAYADCEFTNDVGYLPDGTPLNRAGNAINHPENIGPDSHAPGSPLPRANFVNSVGYLPDGTPLNAAGNAINHPETMGPDMHTPGSPLPASVYAADVGYLVDGTPMETAGNLSVQGGAAPAAPPPVAAAAFVGSSAPVSSPAPAPAAPAPAPAVSSPGAPRTAMYGRKFEYSFQKDAYADCEFTNDVGYLPDGTPLNRAGNAINHPENIGPDSHAPGSPLPRANFVNSVGYLPDGTPLNAAGNAINHPETMGPDMHTPGSPLPASIYAADVGYLVDGTPMETAGNLSVQGGAAPAAPAASAPTPTPPPVVAAAFVGSSAAPPSKVRHGGSFAYGFQKDSFCDLEFSNDIGYLPDGTPLNMAGNAINHPENIQPDSHAPGSPLPSAIFVNDVGYLPDGTPLNRAGNAINHPETIGPDMHTPGSPLPPSTYAQDRGAHGMLVSMFRSLGCAKKL